MLCKTCNIEKPDDRFITCEKCRTHNRELYNKRKETANNQNKLVKHHVSEMTILTMTMVNLLHGVLKTSNVVKSIFHDKVIIGNTKDVECAICLSAVNIGDSIYEIPCAHIFHTHCMILNSIESNHCPICRLELFEKSNTEELLESCDSIVLGLSRNIEDLFSIISTEGSRL